MSDKKNLMDAHVTVKEGIDAVDRLLTTWLTNRNRPFTHDKAHGVYVRTRAPEVPFDNELITSRLVTLLDKVGVHGITVEHGVDGAALRLTIPDSQPIRAIETLASTPKPLSIHEVRGGGR